jgi:hypothetical protein
MASFQTRFDSHVADANGAAVANNAALLSHPIRLHAAHIRRLIANISKLLGMVDSNQAKHPEFLAATPTIVPEKAIELVAAVKPSIEAGSDNFVQNILPQLVEVEDKLNKAVGLSDFKVAEIKNQQVRALNQILDRAEKSKQDADSLFGQIKKDRQESLEGAEQVKEAVGVALTDKQVIERIKTAAEKLANGHARQGSLELLVRTARAKLDEIETKLTEATEKAQLAATQADLATGSADTAQNAVKGLESSNKRAQEILTNATQAGLAGAYKTERENLKSQQNIFACVFYGIIAAILTYAIIFLLPIFKNLLENNEVNNGIAENAEVLLVRLLILAPAVWALIFTNKRYVNLETLQMDYAAKSATALAYSGYRDEMADDPELSRQLKDGLLVRFIEHPSRLINGNSRDDLKNTLGMFSRSSSGEDRTHQNSVSSGPDRE